MEKFFWFFLLPTPLIIFAVKPEAPRWRRFGSLLLAIGISVVILLIHFHFHDQAVLAEMNNPNNPVPIAERQSPESKSFTLFLILNLTLAYVGLWEFIWRLRHRKGPENIFGAQDGRLTNIVFGICFLFTILWIFMLLAA